MAKVHRIQYYGGDPYGWRFWCPGCREPHSFRTSTEHLGETNKPVWTFNGDADNPTFSPSLGIKDWDEEARTFRGYRCHLFVRDGQIQFLDDSKHALAGQTVEMADSVSMYRDFTE